MTKLGNRFLILLLTGTLFSAQAQEPADSTFLTREQRDEELAFIVRQIDSVYIYGHRGASDEEWEKRVEALREKLQAARTQNEYLYALRYTGTLIQDGHFTFPDMSYYNRHRVFLPTDTLFPISIKNWKDGTTFVQRDPTGHLPEDARILRVNGRSAQEMACVMRSIPAWEKDGEGFSIIETGEPAYWYSLMNFLFMEGEQAPYRVEYVLPGSERVDTVTLAGMTRGELREIAKKKRQRSRDDNVWSLFFGDKTISRQRIGAHSAVVSIDYFVGQSPVAMILGLGKKDRRYSRKLRRAMAWVDRNRIDTLVLDISGNGDGMIDNVYKTLNYLTTRSVDANKAYRVTDANREKIKTVIRNTQYDLFGLTPEQQKQMAAYVDSIPDGSFFTTDMVYDLRFRPDSVLKHRYRGQAVYLLTGSGTYSAAQLFAQHFKEQEIGLTAGEPCGGYASISGGNAQWVRLPYTDFSFTIPYSSLRNDVHAPRFEFEPVDIPLQPEPISCEEWLAGKQEEGILPRFLRWLQEQHLSK
ncbi:S41 family peptidase [uncultured Rikenella sp.]|uniref:S41 family peptidase n=1 Tax=uncultured Rikenella sp. TaxID=368003 RepID=UPI00262328BA|nr:S41 family peptidase [uncultured Rikenella sp.]